MNRNASISRVTTSAIRRDIIRAVIYARYQSDQQREASIADQVEVCRRYADRQGWSVLAIYDDAALSGSSTRLRPGFQRMVFAAEAGQFDVIICEAVDRLGRNLSDVAGLHDRLVFRGWWLIRLVPAC